MIFLSDFTNPVSSDQSNNSLETYINEFNPMICTYSVVFIQNFDSHISTINSFVEFYFPFQNSFYQIHMLMIEGDFMISIVFYELYYKDVEEINSLFI